MRLPNPIFAAQASQPTHRVGLVLAVCLISHTCFSAETRHQTAKQDAIVVRAIERMVDYDFRDDPEVVAAVRRHIERQRGSSEFIKLVEQFRPPGMESTLIDLILNADSINEASQALDLLRESKQGRTELSAMLNGTDAEITGRIASLLGSLGNPMAINMLNQLLLREDATFDQRIHAIRGLSKSNLGCERILKSAENGSMPAEVRLLAGGLLAQNPSDQIRQRAAKFLPLPEQSDREPLAPLDQLAKIAGDLEHGRKLFAGVATCANCHVVGGAGKQVGPDLSEIGSKLSREAMFTAILDPSAGISHNYENFVVLLDSGQVISGVMVSETDDEIVLRTAEAIDRTVDKEEIEEMEKSEKSIMPENLHHTTDQQGLVDLVEYLMSLKKKV